MCIATGLLCLLENTHVAPEGSTLDLEDEGSYPYLSHLFLFLIKHSVCSPHWKFLTPSPKLLSDLPASSLPDLPPPRPPPADLPTVRGALSGGPALGRRQLFHLLWVSSHTGLHIPLLPPSSCLCPTSAAHNGHSEALVME